MPLLRIGSEAGTSLEPFGSAFPRSICLPDSSVAGLAKRPPWASHSSDRVDMASFLNRSCMSASKSTLQHFQHCKCRWYVSVASPRADGSLQNPRPVAQVAQRNRHATPVLLALDSETRAERAVTAVLKAEDRDDLTRLLKGHGSSLVA